MHSWEDVRLQFRVMREEREYSVEQFAQLCGVTKGTISKIENGKQHPSIKVFFKMCEVLGYEIHLCEDIPSTQTHTYTVRESLYRDAAQLMTDEVVPKGERQILIAVLHGHHGRRVRQGHYPNQAFQMFDESMKRCIMSSGSNAWDVRIIYNITSDDRLDMIVARLEDVEGAERHEIRAFCLDTIPHLSPLVVGKKDAFLAIEDPRYYRVSKGMRLHDQNLVEIVIEYFNSLWNDKRALEIRSAVGIERENISILREKLKR